MRAKKTPPEIKDGGVLGKRRSHPSYGVVQISRVNGKASLFQSSFEHHSYIELRICEAEAVGDTGDRTYAGKRLIEVAMSESQFARAITSLNMGSGSPVTLMYVNGKQIEQAEREDEIKSHKKMVAEKLEGNLDNLVDLAKQIQVWREAKHRPTLAEMDDLHKKMDLISGNFAGNMEFYAGLFEEHIEAVVDSAKAEVEAHALMTTGMLGVQQRGPELLGGIPSPHETGEYDTNDPSKYGN